jgi:hypothetical protein
MLSLLAGMARVPAGPLVHEPFDYPAANHPLDGRLEGKNGGTGFGGPWVDSSGDNLGIAFVYDSAGNPDALYGGTFGGGQPDWDGVVDNLPTRGGYAGLSDWSNQGSASEDKWNSHRPLAASAGEMAGDDGILWLSAVWHWPGPSLQNRPGIALTSGGHFGTQRSEFLTSAGTGIGVGNGNVGGFPSAVLNATVWSNGNEVVQTGAGGMSAGGDHVIVLKFEFGAIDKVSAWAFAENQPLLESTFNLNAAAASFALDEHALRTLAFAAHRKETAVDEFRIGRTFLDVTTAAVEPPRPFEITRIVRHPETAELTLTWRSTPGETYGLQWSPDLKTFYPGLSQSIMAHPTGDLTTFGPFPAPSPGAARLFLRVGPPDTAPPELLAMGGGGDRVVIRFSEPMLPGSATDPANYLLQTLGGATVPILAAAIGSTPDTVVLTLGASLEEGASYTVTAQGVSDPAGLPLAPGSRIGSTAWSAPLITEFMASNGNNIHRTTPVLDEDGEDSDWIEIFNPTAGPVDLDGWHLTDSAGNPAKWRLPAVTLDAGAYLLVFASGKDRANPAAELHANFSLSADGEYLALVRPDGTAAASPFAPAFPPQTTGVSYGLAAGGSSSYRFFDTPTAGAPNPAGGSLGLVADVAFDTGRGFYESPLGVQLSCPTPDATIRYTLDMSEPSLTHGSTAEPGVPLPVHSTTCLRARAFKPGWLPGNIVTHTYLFPAAVIAQPADPPGFPTTWKSAGAVYQVDPAVMGRYATPTLTDSLKSLPSVSIVTDMANLFDDSTGIYDNPYGEGEAWERAASMEWIDPRGGPESQANCGLRIQGNAARMFPKKPFRLLFKGIYGPSKLDFPVFAGADGAVASFDTITLRANSQSQNLGAITQITDEHGRRTLMDMGNPQSHGTFVHLYVNGLYWGLYNSVERPDASFCADYYGGRGEEWDVNNGNTAIDGSYAPFDAMLAQVRGGPATDAAFQKIQGKLPDGSPDPASPAYLDLPNYLDYLLCNFYLGTGDWSGNASQGTRNYYCGRRRAADSPGYQWFVWDAERSLQTSIPTGVTFGAAEPYAWLRGNAEFRLRFADRAQRHLRHGGALTAAARLPRYTALADQVRAAMIFEEARWDLTTVALFESEVANRTTSWFPGRAANVLDHFRNEGLFPLTDAPTFSPHGGQVAADTPVTLASAADAIYYTLDGSDPRLPGGAPAPGALAATFAGAGPLPVTYLATGHVWRYLDNGSDQGTAWRAAAFDDSAWSAGPSQLGYGENNEGSGTVVGFGPNPSIKYPTTYFRTTVNLPDPASWDHFRMRLKYDDGVAVHVNGNEVLRANLAAGATYNQYASGNVANEDQWKDFTLDPAVFTPGLNTLAVEIHQAGAASSDIRFDMTLRGEPAGGAAANVSDPLFFPGPTLLKARSYNSAAGEWSALNEAFFQVESEPAGAANLAIGEIHYHPADPSGTAELAASGDKNDFEFIELHNHGSKAIDLTGVSFTRGITFAFADRSFLPAGARAVLVANPAAFAARYGTLAAGVVAGTYAGRLDNAGERLTLADSGGGVIRDFSYDDSIPWPTRPDGAGESLVLSDPASDPALPANWSASAVPGGTPGRADGP